MIRKLAAVATLVTLAGCATPGPAEPQLFTIDGSRLPQPNVTAQIPGLSQCTDAGDTTVRLNAQHPVTVLVHGCFSSAGRYRGMAQVLAFHGQQTLCFNYNDRDSLHVSAGQLNTALDALASKLEHKNITVIGHSQGALIARKAVSSIESEHVQLRLVTVSGPFGGIAAARHCGNPLWRKLSLGVVNGICQIVTGDKWSEITYSSPFILKPAALDASVKDFLKIETDERGTCRRTLNGSCVESDAIFSLAEQRNAVIDSDPRTSIVQVKAGHVEIVGDNRTAPVKLIAVLQEHGVIKATQPEQKQRFAQLLTQLYGVERGVERHTEQP